jgi:hypothetical protein
MSPMARWFFRPGRANALFTKRFFSDLIGASVKRFRPKTSTTDVVHAVQGISLHRR